jgi:hypothetical protein
MFPRDSFWLISAPCHPIIDNQNGERFIDRHLIPGEKRPPTPSVRQVVEVTKLTSDEPPQWKLLARELPPQP